MVKNFLHFLLSLFYEIKDEETFYEHEEKSYSDVVNQPTKIVKKQISKNKPTEPVRLNAQLVVLKIKNNILFLDALIEQFKELKGYEGYLVKLQDLHQQSTGCLRIVFTIKKDAPYYKNTLKAIYSHTQNIAELMNVD